MRIIKKGIAHRNGEGFVRLQADEPEDMYHLFNLICEGDIVRADTVRNVVKENVTGSVKQRMNMKLKIKVERIEFDAEQCSLRLNGRNVEENEFVKMGQYHTLDLEIGRPFAIEKICWDYIFMNILNDACDPGKKAEIAVVVMQEGLANICLLTTAMTITKAKIERKIPKKDMIHQAHDKARSKFFDEVYDAVKKTIDFSVVKVVIVGSPGFLKDDFMKYLTEKAIRVGDMEFIKQKSKFLKAHTSSGFRRAVDELLGNADFASQLNDVKAADEVKALQNFYDCLSSDSDRACYSFEQCNYANQQLAIDTLMVTDKLFKSADFDQRKRYIKLVESVKNNGGKVHTFSCQHVSGEQLNLYTGIAATLRFPLPDIDIILEQLKNPTGKSDTKKSAINSLKKSSAEVVPSVVVEEVGYETDFSDSTVEEEGDDSDDDSVDSYVKDMGLVA